MTLGSGGGSPKTISTVTDTGPFAQSFANRDFYTCPLDTIAIVSPILFSFGSGSISDPENYSFDGIKLKWIDPITGATVRLMTQYGANGVSPSGSPHYGTYIIPSTNLDPVGSYYVQRYEKYMLAMTAYFRSDTNAVVTNEKALGGGIILFPGETLSWGASNSYPNNTNWKLRYGLLEYGISS